MFFISYFMSSILRFQILFEFLKLIYNGAVQPSLANSIFFSYLFSITACHMKAGPYFISEVIMTLTKLFQNVQETPNRPKPYLWTLRKNDNSKNSSRKYQWTLSIYLAASTYQKYTCSIRILWKRTGYDRNVILKNVF